jgi:hypothetical protein
MHPPCRCRCAPRSPTIVASHVPLHHVANCATTTRSRSLLAVRTATRPLPHPDKIPCSSTVRACSVPQDCRSRLPHEEARGLVRLRSDPGHRASKVRGRSCSSRATRPARRPPGCSRAPLSSSASPAAPCPRGSATRTPRSSGGSRPDQLRRTPVDDEQPVHLRKVAQDLGRCAIDTSATTRPASSRPYRGRLGSPSIAVAATYRRSPEPSGFPRCGRLGSPRDRASLRLCSSFTASPA